jgi:drug/metabolite transporter (DMT)-like permease
MLTDDRLHRRGLTLAGAGMVVLSPDALLIRLIDDADLFQIVFYRTLFMGIVLALGLGAYYGHRLPALMVALGWRGALSSVLMAASNVGFVGAMLNASVANALVILATIPIFGALFSWLLLGERIRRQTAIAILLAIAGVLVIVSGSLGRGSLLGDAIALGIAVMQGLNLTILRGAGDKDATLAICIAGFLAAAAALPLTGTLRVSAHDLGLLALLGGLVLPLALGLFMAGARYAPAAEVGLMALLETTLGPIWVWVGVGEVPPDEAFIGGALVVGAIVANSVMPSRGDGPISRRPPRGARAGRSRPRERRSRAPRRGT